MPTGFRTLCQWALLAPALTAACHGSNTARERESKEDAYRSKLVIAATLDRPDPSSTFKGCRINGTITNTGPRSVESWAARISLKDASGAILRTETAIGHDPLAPNERRPLTLMAAACAGATTVSGEIELVALAPQ